MRSYAVDESTVWILVSSSPREREDLLRIFGVLAAHPNLAGDFTQHSAALREFQVKRFEKWLITYSADPRTPELRIVDVQRLVP